MADRPGQLLIRLHDRALATCVEDRRGRILMTHDQDALARWGRNTPVLSCSLPSSAEPLDATAFLDGYLPEGQARYALAAARSVATEWGEERTPRRPIPGCCWRPSGGTSRAPSPSSTRSGRPRNATPTRCRTGRASWSGAVVTIDDAPFDLHDDSELSLAGVQNKLLLVRTADGWARPAGGLPSTHICKPEPLAHPGLVDLEAAALRLARAVGLTTINADAVSLGGRPCLIVDRYDRVVDSRGVVVRVHQEDLCQATGRDPRANRRRAKYERHGGPGFTHAAMLLRTHARDWEEQLDRLAGAMVFTVLIGNSDAHGKNLSLLHPEPGRVELAPLYDTVPTLLLPHLRVRVAMEINGVHTSLEDVGGDDLSPRWSVGSGGNERSKRPRRASTAGSTES